MQKSKHTLITKPEIIDHFEHRLGRLIPLHPNFITLVKLFIVLPLLYLSLKQPGILYQGRALTLGIFVLFCLLDYLDGLVARAKELETRFGRVFDRISDLPLLIVLTLLCLEIVPKPLLFVKIGLDFLLLLQFYLNKGTQKNRIRTSINYALLAALLFLSQGWAKNFINLDFVNGLLFMSILFSAIFAIRNFNIIHRYYIADMLSFSNMACGGFSMYFAYLGRFDVSVLFLMLGAAFDGFDGAAARKWGGTRWGVYSDDVADGVNYGIAPGVALWLSQGTWEGAVLGFLFSFFTISRLVFFTLNKGESDPNFFQGVPSTAGGLIVLCSLVLFPDSHLLLGLFTGIACVQMVSFNTYYRHLGRAMGTRKKRYIYGVPALMILMIVGYFIWGVTVTVAILFAIVILYGFSPVFMQMKDVMKKKTP